MKRVPRGRVRCAAERGFALLVVLWTVTLLALIATQITALGRGDAQLSANLRRAASIEAAADGAVQETIFHLLDPSDRRWAADGGLREIRRHGVVSTVRASDEAGKVNPNTAPPEIMQAVLRASGVDMPLAGEIADAMALWRMPTAQPERRRALAAPYRTANRGFGPPGEPFQTLDEIGLVLGMTPMILARIAPHLSVYNEGAINGRAADAVVRQAVVSAVGTGLLPEVNPEEAPRIVSIVVDTTDGRARFVRCAVVALQAAEAGFPYAILQWDTTPLGGG